MSNLVKRVVVGNKPYSGIDHKTGERAMFKPDEECMVTAQQARAFKHVLQAPEVIEARKKAEAAEREAQAAADKANAAADKLEAKSNADKPDADAKGDDAEGKGDDGDGKGSGEPAKPPVPGQPAGGQKS